MSNVLREMGDALTDFNYPLENAISLGIVEMYNRDSNPLWIKAWIELNADRYTSPRAFAVDLMEIFDL